MASSPTSDFSASVPTKNLLHQAGILVQQGQFAEAERRYEEVFRREPQNAEVLHQLGVIALQTRRNERGAELIARALKLDPKLVGAYSNLAYALSALKRHGDAVASCDRALALEPRFAEAHNNRANALNELKRHIDAIGSADRAIELRPNYVEAHYNRANALKALGRDVEALASYDEVLKISPNHTDAYNNRGNALNTLKRHEDALASYDRAIALRPAFPEAHCNRGNALKALGRGEEALASCDRAIALKTDFADAYYNRGNILDALKHHEEALASYDRAIALNPNYAEAYNNRGNALNSLARHTEALASYEKAIALNPDYGDAHNNRGNALHDLARYDEALVSYDKAIALQPTDPMAHNNRGNSLVAIDRCDDALASFARAIALKPQYAEAYSNRGNALQEMGHLDDAAEAYHNAIEFDPSYAVARNNLGNLLQERGRLDEAYACYDQAIALQPRRGLFYRMLASAGRITPESPHYQQLQELEAGIVPSLPDPEKLDRHFALGAMYEHSGQPERALRHLIEGNRMKRSKIEYDESALFDMFERIRSVFTAKLLEDSRLIGVPSQLPIFVVGMPRSGTTLVEQILSSHPSVFGAGELTDLGRLAEAPVPPAITSDYPEAFAGLPKERLQKLAQTYLEQLRSRAPDASRIVDKLPHNFTRVGLIRLALPQARIIHTRRDPVDTCMSCFSHLFTGHLPYTYDLAELGRFYRAYERLMAHWRAVLPPGGMLEVSYEEVVGDLEGQARRMIAYCGLDWDDRCLEFHRNQRPVRTSSAMQVRQPLYGSSVGRWRVFGDLAKPLLDALGEPAPLDVRDGAAAR